MEDKEIGNGRSAKFPKSRLMSFANNPVTINELIFYFYTVLLVYFLYGIVSIFFPYSLA